MPVAPPPLTARSALVTGASRGIGEAVARHLAALGARVHLLARSRRRLEALADELGGTSWVTDLEDDAAVWDSLDRLQESEGGPPDVVVNAAGVFDLAPLAETPVRMFDRNLALNLRGPFLVLRALLPAVLERGSGTLVTVGSVSGRRAFPANGAYAASKFGLRGLHEVLVEELRGTGVRATLVEPAATDTGIWDPMDPDGDPDLPDREAMLQPGDVAEAVAFAVTRPDHVRIPFLPVEPG